MNTKIETIFPLLQVTEDGLVVSKNGDISLFFEIKYPEIFITSNNQYSQVIESLMNACRSLGEGFIIHKQDFFVEEKYKPDFSYTSDEIIRENERYFSDRPFTKHRGFIYLTLVSSDPMKRNSAMSSLFKKSLVSKKMHEKKYLGAFYERVNSFVSAVNQTKILTLTKLSRDAIVGTKDTAGLLNYYFTFSFDDTNIYDINKENSNFKVGNKNTYTFVINDLEQFPNEVAPLANFKDFSGAQNMPISFGSSFGMNLPFNHVYNQIFYVCKQAQLISDKVAETKKHYSFSSWSRDNTFSMEQKTRFVDTMKHGELAVKAHFNIQIFHENLNVLNEYKDITSGAIANSQFASKMATTYSEQLYWSCIPGNCQEVGSDNLFTCFLSNAISLLALETNYEASPYQPNGLLLTDRFGLPRIVDIFMKPRTEGLIDNRNFTLVGPSGSGKSFFTNNLIYYLRYSGAHITIVDIGHSYKRLGQVLGAKYVEHSDENPISLNPFYIDPLTMQDSKLNEEFKQVIVQILFLLYKKESERERKSEEVTLFNMVNEFYKHIAHVNSKVSINSPSYIKPSFNSFYEFVRDAFPAIFEKTGGRAEKEFDITNFLYIIQPFYKGGQYDYLLNGSDETELSKHPFVIYELDNIKDHQILLPIITLMITNSYITKLFNVRGVLKVLIIEEAWKAISSDYFAQFLLWAFKTARKHFGSIGVVTQEIEDLLKSPIIRETIVQNADIKIILDIKKYEENSDTIFDLFKISKSNQPQIFSINKQLPSSSHRGAFKETAIILGKKCKVYGTEVSKYAYSLFTTEATEVDQIKAIAIEQNVDLKEASIIWADNNL